MHVQDSKIPCPNDVGSFTGFEIYKDGQFIESLGNYDRYASAITELKKYITSHSHLEPYEVKKIMCEKGRRSETFDFDLEEKCHNCNNDNQSEKGSDSVTNPPKSENLCTEYVHPFTANTLFVIEDYMNTSETVRIMDAYDSEGRNYLHSNINTKSIFVGKKAGFRNKIVIETNFPTTLTIIVKLFNC